MPRKKTTKARSGKKNAGLGNKLVLLGFFLLILGAIFAKDIYYNLSLLFTSPIIESPKTEMKKIPPDVKNAIPNKGQAYVVPILMYHYVEHVKDPQDAIRRSLDTLPEVLESQIKTLKDANYTFLTVGELAQVIDGKRRLPKKAVVLTFDDGYRDFYTDVAPILRKYNAKATIYVISGFVGHPNYMFEGQIKELLNEDLVEVGAHTVHHVSLIKQSPNLLKSEVSGSRKMLEETFEVPVVSFAYPNGEFDLSAINAVKDAGFTNAASTIQGIKEGQQNKYFLFRIRPGLKKGSELLNHFQDLSKKEN